MSDVTYNDHPASVSVDANADWVPFWKTGSNGDFKTTPTNLIAGAALPAANLTGTVALALLPSQAASTLLGRPSSGAGVPQALTLAAEFNISAGGVLQLTGSYQPLDSDLTAIAAVATQAFGRSLLTSSNAAVARTLVELNTPTGWGTTDKLATTHSGSLLADIGAGTSLLITPITTATDAGLNLTAKGTGTASLTTASGDDNIVIGPGQVVINTGGFQSATFSGRQLTDSAENVAVDWQTRELFASDGVTTIIDWDNLSLVGDWSIGHISTSKISSNPQSTTLAAAAVTLAVSSSFVILTGDAAANTLATITGGRAGMELTILFRDSLVTITDTAANTADTVNLSAAFTGTANDTLTLKHDGTKWFEKSRSVN